MRRAAIPTFQAHDGHLLLRQRSSSSGPIRESLSFWFWLSLANVRMA